MRAKPKLRVLAATIRTIDTRSCPPPAKQAEPIYLTPEYAEWRAKVIARANGRCQNPNCRTPERTPSRLFADHIHELRDGGSPFDPANGMALCGACHTRKTMACRAKRLAE